MTEAQIHRAVVDHLRTRAPGLLFWHTPNGGFRNAREAANLKRMGVLPGVSDILALHDGELYALELKAYNGRATEHQLKFRDRVNECGGYASIAEGLDEALAHFKAWGFIR